MNIDRKENKDETGEGELHKDRKKRKGGKESRAKQKQRSQDPTVCLNLTNQLIIKGRHFFQKLRK